MAGRQDCLPSQQPSEKGDRKKENKIEQTNPKKRRASTGSRADERLDCRSANGRQLGKLALGAIRGSIGQMQTTKQGRVCRKRAKSVIGGQGYQVATDGNF